MPQVAATSAPPVASPVRPSRARAALRVVERALAIAGLVLLVYHGGFDVAEVISGSMGPTLQGTKAGAPTNDWVLYETVTPRVAAPPRGSLVVFRNEDGVEIVKRVAGEAGERLRIIDGQLEVDGRLLPPPAPGVHYLRAGRLRATPDGSRTYEVPAGDVFLLGDDSKDSWDGRYFGGVSREQVHGRAVAIVWPPSRWRFLW
jgi:signal peptidase I